MATITKFQKFSDLTRERWGIGLGEGTQVNPCVFAFLDAINSVEDNEGGVTGIQMTVDEETDEIDSIKYTVQFNRKRPAFVDPSGMPAIKAIKNELGCVVDNGDQWGGADSGPASEGGV